jgi:rare lipoprotein A
MAQAALRHIVFGLAATGLLIGCVDGAGSGKAGSGKAPGAFLAGPARATAAGDVEAPEIFQVTDSALWDGRPSLGGIWVASPDVTDPERVVMVNPATGKTVQGALFRRERDNPGPPLQISSDAAEALGMLAGQPAEIRVTALRRVEAEPAPAEAAAPPAAEVAAAATEAPEAATPDSGTPAADPSAEATAAAATAALAAAGTAADAAADAGADAAAPDAAEAEAAVVEPPKRKTWKERRAEAKAAREAKKAAAAAAKAAADGESAAAEAEIPATPEAAGVAEIETAPLDATGTAANAPPPAAPVAQTETPAPTGRAIQVASFSKEANATRAVEALAKIGVPAQTRKSEVGGKAVWGVVASGDDALLGSIKAAGFADAFFLQ